MCPEFNFSGNIFGIAIGLFLLSIVWIVINEVVRNVILDKQAAGETIPAYIEPLVNGFWNKGIPLMIGSIGLFLLVYIIVKRRSAEVQGIET